VNLFEMLEGGKPIVEDGTLLNGVFGRMTTNYMKINETVADVLYLTSHALEKSLPQPAFIIFGGRCKHTADFEVEAADVLKIRKEFQKELGNLVVEKNRFKLSDPTHDTTIKFRLICTVWDAEKGELLVLGDGKKPLPFIKWVGLNLNDILSASNPQLDAIKQFANKEGGLLDQLRNPKSNHGGYTPWTSLLEEVRKSGGITEPILKEGDVYRQAVKIWRYSTLMIAVEDTKQYQERWNELKALESILHTHPKLACDDGRQSGDVKVLGSIITYEEFLKMFVNSNLSMETLRVVPHYKCGFLTATHNMHLMLERLKMAIMQETDDFELNRKLNFFTERLKHITEEDGKGPVEWRVLRDYLPQHLADELTAYMTNKEPIIPENRKFVENLHSLFSAPEEKLRRVLRRGIVTGVMKMDEGGFVQMPAARFVHKGMLSFFGDGYRQKFTANQINNMVIEEVARWYEEKITAWMSELPADSQFKAKFFLDNFATGQAIVIPERPTKPADFENLTRQDYYLTREFSPKEVEALGLTGKKTWTLV
jgi:hypothetical protein